MTGLIILFIKNRLEKAELFLCHIWTFGQGKGVSLHWQGGFRRGFSLKGHHKHLLSLRGNLFEMAKEHLPSRPHPIHSQVKPLCFWNLILRDSDVHKNACPHDCSSFKLDSMFMDAQKPGQKRSLWWNDYR